MDYAGFRDLPCLPQLRQGSREEIVPGLTPGFPFARKLTLVHLSPSGRAPWHYHPAVELFYIEKGGLEYQLPHGTYLFPEGSGGLVNCKLKVGYLIPA